MIQSICHPSRETSLIHGPSYGRLQLTNTYNSSYRASDDLFWLLQTFLIVGTYLHIDMCIHIILKINFKYCKGQQYLQMILQMYLSFY